MNILNAIGEFFSVSWIYIIGPFFERVKDIIIAPYQYVDMLWMLLPLLATLLLMEFYFGRYKEEELGWNTAVGNSLVLIFVAIDLFRHVYNPVGGEILAIIFSGHHKIVISLIVFVTGILLLFIDFFHFLPKKIAYIISSPAYINLIGLLGIIIVYSDNLPLDLLTLLACIIIFLMANFISVIIYLIIPSYHPPIKRIFTAEDIEEYEVKRKK